MYVRHTDILIIGRREECLCPSHTSHKARTLHNPEHGSRRPVEAVLVFHLGRALPLHQPCYVSSLRWASAGWRGQAASLGSWSSGTACLAVWQPLLSAAPLYPLEALSHNWKTFLASLGGTHRSLPKHSLGGLSLRDLGLLPYVSSDLFEWMVWMLRLKYKLWQFSEMHHAT